MLWRVSQRRSQEVLERHGGGDVTRQGTGLEGGQREAERHNQG